MSLRRAVVMVVVGCRQTPRYWVFPERRLPGRLKQTGVCVGKSRELHHLFPPRPISHFLSRLLSPVSRSLITLDRGHKLVSRKQMFHQWNLSWAKKQTKKQLCSSAKTDPVFSWNQPLDEKTDRWDAPRPGAKSDGGRVGDLWCHAWCHSAVDARASDEVG